MNGEKSYFKELKPYYNSYVNFGNETIGRIKGIGELVSPCFSCLDDVLFVEGLTANFEIMFLKRQMLDHMLRQIFQFLQPE